jgi:hypothetical protein
MPVVLKHTECPVCGHRHHFCYLGDDLKPGREYDYRCPENAKKARLRPTTRAEVVRVVPQGAVVLTALPPAAAESGRLQEVLPEVKDLATKVGGMENLSDIVETLKDAKE